MSVRPTVLQLRYRDDRMRITCNQYIEAFTPRFRTVVVFLTGGEKAGEVSGDEVRFLGLESGDLKGLRLKARRLLAEVVAAEKPVLVLAHRWKSAPLAVSALNRAGLGSVPVFAVVHALGQMRSFSRVLVGRFVLKKRCRFIGVSEAVKNDILDSGFGLLPDEVLALPNAIDIEATTAALLPRRQAREELGLSPEVPVAGHIGRLVSAKDQATLIASFARLRERVPQARLVLIGAGRLEEKLRCQVEDLGLDRAVLFAGAVDRAFRLLKAFDLFALTSVTEGFPRVLLEAMVARLPIVATDAGGIREALGEDFELCRPGDVEGIATALEKVLTADSTFRLKLGEKNFQRVREHFSSTIFRERLLGFAARSGVAMPEESGERR